MPVGTKILLPTGMFYIVIIFSIILPQVPLSEPLHISQE